MKPDKEKEREFPREIAITSVREYGKALIVTGYAVEETKAEGREDEH